MNFVDRIVTGLGYELKQNGGQGRPAAMGGLPAWVEAIGAQAWYTGEVSDPSLYKTQAQRYSRSDLIYACVTRIAESGAMASLDVFQTGGDTEEPIADHPFETLIARPNPWMSRFTLFENTLGCLELTGNAYWYLWPEQGTPMGIWPLRPDRIKPLPDKEQFIRGYEYTIGSWKDVLDPARVVHFKRWHPLKDYQGLSPIEAANYASSSDIAAQKANWAMFANQMVPSGVFENEKERHDKEQRQLMEKQFLTIHTGDPGKFHQPLFLWDGWTWREVGIKPRDAEYVEGRKMNRMDIFLVYGVHPGLVLAEDVNLANARVAEYVFAKYTMLPKLSRIGEQMNISVMPYFGENEIVRFVDVVPRDRELDATIYSQYLDRGVVTVNEVRAGMGLSPVEWGDVPYTPMSSLFGGAVKTIVLPPTGGWPGRKVRPLMLPAGEQPLDEYELASLANLTPQDLAQSKRAWEKWAPALYDDLLDAGTYEE